MRYIAFSHCAIIENEKIKTYGVAVLKGLHLIRVIKDIATDRKAVKRLVKDLNDYQIELCHLDDILEDFLCQQ